jgi:hypothetical protein
LCDESGEVVIIAPAAALHGDGDVGNARSVVADPDLGANEVGLLLLLGDGICGVILGFGGDAREVLLSEFNELLVGNATGSNEHHAVGGVVGLDVVLQVGALNRLNVLLGAENGPSEWLTLERSGVEVVEHDFLELLVHLFLLTENDVALAFDGLGVEFRVLQDIGENVDGGGDVVVERLGVVDGIFALSSINSSPAIVCTGDIPKCRR